MYRLRLGGRCAPPALGGVSPPRAPPRLGLCCRLVSSCPLVSSLSYGSSQRMPAWAFPPPNPPQGGVHSLRSFIFSPRARPFRHATYSPMAHLVGGWFRHAACSLYSHGWWLCQRAPPAGAGLARWRGLRPGVLAVILVFSTGCEFTCAQLKYILIVCRWGIAPDCDKKELLSRCPNSQQSIHEKHGF